jgi:ATP-dependent helicase YprA (DUF1998 family)
MDSLSTRFEQDVFESYLELLRSEYRPHPQFAHARQIWEEKLTKQELVNGPYLEKSQMYAPGERLESLSLRPKTMDTIRRRLSGRALYRHQTDALKLILNGKNAVIATGTSSGKTLCYQIPILDDLVRDSSPGLRAIIIYPLNALVNDQLNEWEEMLKAHPQVTFARFTGQTPASQQEYEAREREVIRAELMDKGLTQRQREYEVQQELQKKLGKDPSNRLNHREAIRENPPHILITNFSMLEYLMERPVDAPVFEDARLKFLVLDEAHAYRGVQATEIGFLVRRLKDRLGLEKLTCIATSATLGKPDDPSSLVRVRKFASDLFNDEFTEPNPIYGTAAQPQLDQPSVRPSIAQYLKAAAALRDNDEEAARQLGATSANESLATLLGRDENLYRLRKEILTKPILLDEAADRLWPDESQAKDGLQALLEIIARAKQEEGQDDLLPTRLHYFVRAQDGLHVCLHRQCPGRRDGKAAFFVSRKNGENTPEGWCPECWSENRSSRLVEIMTCRKCGYLYGALQDLWPRRAQNPDRDEESQPKPHPDSFDTELGWAADSFWSYFSVEDDLPYPSQLKAEEDDEDEDNLLFNPEELQWCIVCGKKNDPGAGDNCQCESPHLRLIKIFHRQCPHTGKAKDNENAYKQQKKLLLACPNCGARNASGLEPVRRFQESEDETGLAMALPLAHFQVSSTKQDKLPRKLLCFTDHRQRAAAFPALLEEETFAHDLGRKIVKIVGNENRPLDLESLGERLADMTDQESASYDPDFFLPTSRFPDEEPDARKTRDLWLAETFSYFGIPDAARESAEDLGLVAVTYQLKAAEQTKFHQLLAESGLSLNEATAALQTLLAFVRQRKAFTLPKAVQPNAPAFGRVTADIGFALRREGIKNVQGWLPRLNKDGSYRNNYVTDYLRRWLKRSPDETLAMAEQVWEFLTKELLLFENRGKWKLDHERLFVIKPPARYVCDRCQIVTAYAAGQCCPRKECDGTLRGRSFEPSSENIIARWVAGAGDVRFTTLKSEEHTAQINKDLARRIEDEFRVEGVNLLSSTTTFEMGINIGDLQKVLLRNAPPTSASYVQRVGRAGRGGDKNAVCVTLCRRTKYDADMWADPPRLMSGEVRTLTVFTQNRVIAQRHFNAVVFARFLRAKIADERLLGDDLKQLTPLAFFLPLDTRRSVPENFIPYPSGVYLDFPAWMAAQSERDVFATQAGRSIIEAIANFDLAKEQTKAGYEEVIASVAEELSALMQERDRLHKKGFETEDINRAVKNLLNGDVIALLAKRGFLPRYAFPLDVVPLETGLSRWSRNTEVELNRERGVAIAEFAPGAQVIARKKVFTSAGLYVVSRTDKPDRLWYAKCPTCQQIRTAVGKDSLLSPCSVCQRAITAQHIMPFIEPVAFSVRYDPKGIGAERHRRNSLIRQRQSLTHFIDSVDEASLQDMGLFRIDLKEGGKLFRYNLGPQNKGFMLCKDCGCSEPMAGFKAGKKHKRLRPAQGTMDCSTELPWGTNKGVAYGHQFESFCLIARPNLINPPIESLAYALQKGLCRLLEVESADIGVSWRWLSNKRSGTSQAEVILYDHTPGGAGFVREGFENWQEVIAKALEICENCSCDIACYDCLKDYSNQSYHEILNRNNALRSLT